MNYLRTIVIVSLLTLAISSNLFGEPQPGDIFREYTYPVRFSELDPSSTREGEGLPRLRAASLKERVLEVDDLRHATKAEIVIEYWGGHIGTSGQKFRINQHDWMLIPQSTGTPTPPQCYYRTLLRATVPVPLAQFRPGSNTFQFTAGPQICHGFNWGFYWVYAFTVRVYYKAERPHPTGRIISHSDGNVVDDLPRFVASTESDHATVSRVDFIGEYEDFNWEGDGLYHQWHYYFEQGRIKGHIGSSEFLPYATTWDTSWVPDQDRPIRIAARITDSLGVIFMTPALSLKLQRKGRSVKMYKPSGVPENFGVRVGNKKTCEIEVADDLSKAREVRLLLSTWSAAHDGEIGLNGSKLRDRVGVIHNYSFDSIPVPRNLVKKGTNTFYITSPTKEHAAEVNWPGPVLLIEFRDKAETALHMAPRSDRQWWDSRWHYRVPVTVWANGFERRDKPAEIEIDFAKALDDLGSASRLQDMSIRVVEVNADGGVLDDAVQFQFDSVEAYESRNGSRGILTVFLKGTTPKDKARHFHVYFDSSAGFQAAPPLVQPVQTIQYEGQESFKVVTRNATYFYHKQGAGLASLLDRDGNDWISYHPGGRSAGEFRGIPNMGRFGHPGYTGEAGVTSRVVSSGPLRSTIVSEQPAKAWRVRWDFFPDYARLSILTDSSPYWFLYEGTPGGKFDETAGFHVLSNGLRRSNKEHWSGDMPAPEWIYFGDVGTKRMLYLINHEDDDATDQYWPMEGNMTVFGFGRQYRCCGQYLERVPAHFTIGFGEDSEFSKAEVEVSSAFQNLRVEIGKAEVPSGAKGAGTPLSPRKPRSL